MQMKQNSDMSKNVNRSPYQQKESITATERGSLRSFGIKFIGYLQTNKLESNEIKIIYLNGDPTL